MSCTTPLLVWLLLVVLELSSAADSKITHDLSECTTNEDCPQTKVCSSQTCTDPCHDGVCGENTLCHVTEHVAKCACQADYAGHPFSGCFPAPAGWADCNNTTPSGSSTKETKKKHFHLYHAAKMNWFQSLAHCSSLGMTLATIMSREENDKLVDMIRQADVKEEWSWWIGGSDLGQPGNYIWLSTGSPLTYLKFPHLQPDNHIYQNGEKERCMELRQEWNYSWNDYICDHHNYHVCEEHR